MIKTKADSKVARRGKPSPRFSHGGFDKLNHRVLRYPPYGGSALVTPLFIFIFYKSLKSIFLHTSIFVDIHDI